MGGYYEIAAIRMRPADSGEIKRFFEAGESVFIDFDKAHIHILGE
jgi:hypothetical protein